MASPLYRQASSSSALPESTSTSVAPSPSARNARFSPPNNPSIANIPNFYTHPARTSIFNASGQLNIAGSGPTNTTNMEASGIETGASTTRTGLPSFSRAFSMLVASEAAAGADNSFNNEEDDFFIPSYLENSTYVQKLQEAHKAKVQARDTTRNSTNGFSHGSTTSFNQHPLPPGSHRGMSHTVIERPPASEVDDDLAPLPTRWNKEDQMPGIEVQSNGLDVKHIGPKNQNDRDHEACGIRADHYMPPQCGIYYFEVHILSTKRDDATISIGFSTKTAGLSRPVGWEPESWGYHGDDGRCFTGQNIGRHFGPSYNVNDVVGCGVNFKENHAFFTKNGVKIGTAFHDVARGKLYPTISLKKPGDYIRANFGQTPFVYNIDDQMREERDRVHKAIQATDGSTLLAGFSETDLIQNLVLQFLQHDGYVETARAFAEDMVLQKNALNFDSNTEYTCVGLRDDEDANNRQRIRRAILEGDIDRALKYTNAYYPQVLQENEHVYFRLRCRKFIELVRKAAQLNMRNEPNGNKHVNNQTMDVDLNGSENTSWEADGGENATELAELEHSMLEYGQKLQEEYANDPRVEVSRALNEIWALVAYQNPLKEPQVSHLLDRNGRVTVAEELNSAILLSLGKSSRAALETIYAQSSVLLDDLRQDGGEGAFASVSDVLDGIPQPYQN
ncbi:uncharacterized protein B0J16DRAFT_67590 [Fusarium flagelliforme]|uniref:Uncharacterized protein n=1 Tax=Fusarium flagelliforme TaxID=2675880 RepID=A0A395MJG5_9HYPO|nr:uncharacterized protein B0J16DRAFT_67590 [Fusarium flagelliforme]KAH7192955.1 hypothetical protein B0J16DRAFT_67590 [Fusarium flagelliforme]RFN47443.1 hypothetical protein FIE12Z_8305 [Fusarium flagelliforme]